jgi:hypothetical protein
MRRSLASKLTFGGLALALVVAPFAAPVIAKESKATAAVLSDLLACRGLPDAERLACYDRAVAAFDKAQQSGSVVVVDREQIKEAKRDVFGFNVPTFGKLFERAGKGETVNEVTLTIDHATQDAYGKWTFYMEGGQVWHELDTDELARKPHKGSQARIRHGMVGSYVMNVDGQPSIKVHRDE